MRAEMILLMLVCSAAAADMDQSYTHAVAKDGSSIMGKSLELSLFSGELAPETLQRMKDICKRDLELDCDVDVGTKMVTIREEMQPGSYYSFSADYGLPDVTYTMTLKGLPGDRFAASLGKLLVKAGVAEGGSSSSPLYFVDTERNSEMLYYLRMLEADVSYAVTFPVAITEARAGNIEGSVDGDSASFDIVSVIEEGQPIVVSGKETNWGYIVGIMGVLLLIGLGIAFMRGHEEKAPKPARKRK